MRDKMKCQSGQTAIIIAILIGVFGLLVGSLVFLTRRGIMTGVFQTKSGVAYRLAEAACERGVWKIKESDTVWNSVASGPISGYNNDTIYTDLPGGTYKILIRVGVTTAHREVIGTGYSSDGSVIRAVEVVLYKETVTAAVSAPTFFAAGNTQVHWGPVCSLGNLDLQGAADVHYPRKFARGNIPDRDPNGSTPPNTDNLEWWSYNEPPGVPDPPEIDLEYYKQEAIAQGHYYTNWLKILVNQQDTSPQVRYFEHSGKFLGGTYIQGVVIARGNLSIGGATKGEPTVNVPTLAWKEYQKGTPVDDDQGDTVALNEYPGDAGYQTVAPTYTFPNNSVSLKGFAYCDGFFYGLANITIVGGLQTKTDVVSLIGGMEVYYQDNMSVKTTESEIITLSWKEIEP